MENRIGFGPRVCALLIDFALVMVASFLFGGTIGALFGAAGGAAGGATVTGPGSEAAVLGGISGGMMGAMLGMYLISVLYALVEAFTGASPGKMILKIKIANVDGTEAASDVYLKRFGIKNVGSILGLVAAITGIELLGTIGAVLGMIIFLGMFLVFGANKQALHDVLAKTAVYKVGSIVARA